MTTLTKIEDTEFNSNHPNGINNGYTKEGIMTELPIIGRPYRFDILITSVVTDVVTITEDIIEFRTLNSLYRINL